MTKDGVMMKLNRETNASGSRFMRIVQSQGRRMVLYVNKLIRPS